MSAGVRMFASVMEQMRSQLGRLDERFRTVCAFMRTLARMNFNMPIQCLLCRESSVTL